MKAYPSLMASAALPDISQAQRARLAYLEMRVWFAGELRRPDIEARFGVKPAAASRDLTAYKEMAPANLEYDPVARCYKPTASFIPIFGFSADRVLSWLLQGFGMVSIPARESQPPAKALEISAHLIWTSSRQSPGRYVPGGYSEFPICPYPRAQHLDWSFLSPWPIPGCAGTSGPTTGRRDGFLISSYGALPVRKFCLIKVEKARR